MCSANILCVLVNFNCHCGHVDLAFIQNMNYLILWYLCCWWSLKICMFSGKDRMSHIITFQWSLYMCIYCWYQVISRRLLWARRGGSIFLLFLHCIGNRLVTCQAYILSKLNICKSVLFYKTSIECHPPPSILSFFYYRGCFKPNPDFWNFYPKFSQTAIGKPS